MSFNVEAYRADFPILNEKIHGKSLVYLDNAATTQKPLSVIQAMNSYYEHDNANVHRGLHTLSERATSGYESARRVIQKFINASSSDQIIYTRNTTEAINLVAFSWGKKFLKAGDEVLISTMEHHANIVPWQMICEEKGATLRVIPISQSGEILMDEYEKLLTPRVKMVAVVHASNSLGTINPIQEIVRLAQKNGSTTLVDGSQAVHHFPVNVQEINCDFYAFTGHKVYGPTGIGILYGKLQLLENMPPYQGGGDMIREVTFEKTTYNDVPHKFEAGTPNIVGPIGLAAAIEYIQRIGLQRIFEHEHSLLTHAHQLLSELVPQARIVGTAPNKVGVLSFYLPNVHAYDIGTMLDLSGIAIRTGHHCTQPLMKFFGIPATSRASFALYTTHEEVNYFISHLAKIVKILL